MHRDEEIRGEYGNRRQEAQRTAANIHNRMKDERRKRECKKS